MKSLLGSFFGSESPEQRLHSSTPDASLELTSTSQPSLGPARPPLRPDLDWWKGLNRIHYISFGAQYGILPLISLDPIFEPTTSERLAALIQGGRQSATCLVAFQDAADAEFIASTLRANLETVLQREGNPAPSPSSRCSVLPGSPMFLEVGALVVSFM